MWFRKFNNFGLNFSYHHRISQPFGLPYIYTIEATNHCNLRCPMCPQPVMKRPKGFMDPELFRAIIKKCQPYQFTNTGLHFFGESLIHKDFGKILSSIPDHKDINFGLNTNVQLLNEKNARMIFNSHLKWIVLDYDSFDKERYEKYRVGATHEVVHANIERFLALKKELNSRIKVWVTMIAMMGNEEELEGFKVFWKSRGADYVNVQKFIVHDESLENRYDNLAPKDQNNRIRRDGTCKYPWDSVVITWDGKVVPCCRDYEGSIVLGDITTQSFQEIWKGKPYNNFRKAHLNLKFDNYSACKNCGSFISEPQEVLYPLSAIKRNIFSIFKKDDGTPSHE